MDPDEVKIKIKSIFDKLPKDRTRVEINYIYSILFLSSINGGDLIGASLLQPIKSVFSILS